MSLHVIELIGGIVLILGIGTRIVSVLFAVIMLGAIFTVKLSLGFLVMVKRRGMNWN